MKSVILSATARFLLPILFMFSLFLLVRGHNLPGGGFVGGLVAAAAFMLYAIAHDVEEARRLLRANTISLLGVGLLLALGSGLLSLVQGKAFMTGLWLHHHVPVLGKLGTPVVFDIGVYLVVLGATLTVLFTLVEE
jgi:multicomponent Na+:H+ antiporter subunit B